MKNQFEDIFLQDELACEGILSSLTAGLSDIKRLIASFIKYIENFHPIKRAVINQLLVDIKSNSGTVSTSRLFKLFETSSVGLLYLCNYDLKNIPKLERAIYEVYYKFGVSPDPENTLHNVYIKYDLNNKLQNYIQDKVREWSRTNDINYYRHQIVSFYTRGNLITITTIIYDNEQKDYVENFNFVVPEDKRNIKDLIDINQLQYIAPYLLNSHLQHLNNYRWITTNIDKHLDALKDSKNNSVSKISFSILNMNLIMVKLFYLTAIETAKAVTSKTK